MAKVQILSRDIISKIAAGEVIERPSSVVKELLENSIDADSTNIEIHLKQAGKTLIHIKDNGVGIEPDDIGTIFKRHATSKIHSADDLYAINSLGFRGEALYSVGAVSDVLLRSRTMLHDSAAEIHFRGGKTLDARPSGLPEGTEIEIKELFFNTPARKKFLKSDTAELSQIINIFLPYTILYPKTRFVLTNNDKVLFDLLPVDNPAVRIGQALNIDPQSILEAQQNFPAESASIKVYLGDINIQRSRKDMQFLFVNNRPVHNYAISFHINKAYRLIFPPDINPFFALFIDTPLSNVDVNMHPTKREVKIKNEGIITSVLRPLCENILMTKGTPKKLTQASFIVPEKDAFANLEPTASSRSPENIQHMLFTGVPSPGYAKEQTAMQLPLLAAAYAGAFMNKYLFFEVENSLLVMDQHAAQERIVYEKLKQQIESGKIETQSLITPIILNMSKQETLAWEQSKEKLAQLGFETTLWDKESLAIHAHPVLITKPEIALREFLSGESVERCDMDNLARRACRGSIMAGDKISKSEAEHLKNELAQCADPFTCPHGRPTVIELRESFLNKQFLRV